MDEIATKFRFKVLLAGLIQLATPLYGVEPGEVFALAPQVKVGVDMELCRHSISRTSRIMLTDLISCGGSDVVCSELYGIDIGQSPGPTEVKNITAEQIEAILSDEMPQLQLTLSGPNECLVTSAFESIDKNSVRDLLQNYFDEILTEPLGWKIIVRRVQMRDEIFARPGKLKITLLEGNEANSLVEQFLQNVGWKSINPIISVGDENHQIQCRVQYQIKKLSAIATVPIEAGVILSRDNISTKWVTANKFTASKMLDSSGVIGLMATRRIRANDTITRSVIGRPIVVKKGDSVSISSNESGLLVEQQGEALEAGSLGQTIRVARKKPKKNIKATITGRGQVRGLF